MSISFPWAFGGPTLLNAEDIDGAEASGLTYERRESNAAYALSLLLGQFVDKPRMRAIVRAFAEEIQSWTDAVWQVHTERWVDTAVGAQFDQIGRVLDAPRAGRLDDAYQAFLRARVPALLSDGSWQALVSVLVALGVAATAVTIEPQYPAAFYARVDGTMPEGVSALDAFRLLEQARVPGVRLTLVAPTAALEETFQFSDASSYPVGGPATGFGDTSDSEVGGALAAAYASSEGA